MTYFLYQSISVLEVGNWVGKFCNGKWAFAGLFPALQKGGNMARFKTEYRGVFYREAKRIGKKGKERVFYIVFKKNGKLLEEKVGRQYADDMTPAKANNIRADRIEGRRESRKEKREADAAAKAAKADRWTFTKLWESYEENKAEGKSLDTDRRRFNVHLKPKFGDKEPSKILELDVDRLRINLLKTHSPQTAKHCLSLLKRLALYGVKKKLCPGIQFKIEMPHVDNVRTEYLTPEQVKKLLETLEASTDRTAAAFMKLALVTGLRRGELIKLKWNEVDFERGFVTIANPKGGKSQAIPMNEEARVILKNQPRQEGKEHVFLRSNGLPFTGCINKRVRAIRDAAGLPKDFRPLHGLRHSFASILAESGEADMYVIQKLLTHKSPLMTQRYAHLRDETLKRASGLAGRIITGAASGNPVIEKEASNGK